MNPGQPSYPLHPAFLSLQDTFMHIFNAAVFRAAVFVLAAGAGSFFFIFFLIF